MCVIYMLNYVCCMFVLRVVGLWLCGGKRTNDNIQLRFC